MFVRYKYVVLPSINESAFYGQNQFGFKQEKSCAHAHRVLADVPRQASQQNEQVHICSLDISKAFDSIVHSRALYSLPVNGVNISIIFVLRYWYSHAYLRLKLNGTLMKENIAIYCGVLLTQMIFSL